MSSNTKIQILKLTYCGFSAQIIGTNKVVYCWKFPPKSGTTIPDLSYDSTIEELTPDSHVRKEVFIEFIQSEQTRQANGKWKGGAWGTNNFTVTSLNWFSGLYVGDILDFQIISKGLIKYSPKPFDEFQKIIPETDDIALSCNGIWNGQSYAFYMTDKIMAQQASDNLWMWGNSHNAMNLRLKVLRRGSGPDVDSPNRIVPSAGEHLEPGQSDDARAQALFNLNQEVGIPGSTLCKCYLIPLGFYADPGRDSRYWIYSTIQDGEIVTFGIKRDSSSFARILYIETDDDIAPEETEQEDKIEIKAKWWENVHTIFYFHPESDWMLEDHMKFIPDSVNCISKFRCFTSEEKENYRF